MRDFFLRSGTRQGCPLSLLWFNTALEFPYAGTRQKKELNPKWKRESEIAICYRLYAII